MSASNVSSNQLNSSALNYVGEFLTCVEIGSLNLEHSPKFSECFQPLHPLYRTIIENFLYALSMTNQKLLFDFG